MLSVAKKQKTKSVSDKISIGRSGSLKTGDRPENCDLSTPNAGLFENHYTSVCVCLYFLYDANHMPEYSNERGSVFVPRSRSAGISLMKTVTMFLSHFSSFV